MFEKPVLIVSCQARDDNPLTGSVYMQAMAMAALQGGADAIRANGAEDVAAIRSITNKPIIGLLKKDVAGFEVYITPDLESIKEIALAGADYIAIDVTHRPRPVPLEELFSVIQQLGKKSFCRLRHAARCHSSRRIWSRCGQYHNGWVHPRDPNPKDLRTRLCPARANLPKRKRTRGC